MHAHHTEIQRALCVPGPDLVVCDEGHRIKNDCTNISQALKKIHTRYIYMDLSYALVLICVHRTNGQ